MAVLLDFRVHPGEWAVCRLDPAEPFPSWAAGAFVSLTRTPEELSLVCAADAVPEGVRAERGWAMLELAGPFEFQTTGVLASFLVPLAKEGVPVFAISTYDTDWVLVPEQRLGDALRALKAAGHNEI
ncbi:MAG: ACT domain-containing protein [Acidobacteriota bacterium]